MTTQCSPASDSKLSPEPSVPPQEQTFHNFLLRLGNDTFGVAKACRRVIENAQASSEIRARRHSLYERYRVTTRVIAFSEGASEDGLEKIREEMLQALSREENGQYIVEAIQAAILEAIVDAAKLQSPTAA